MKKIFVTGGLGYIGSHFVVEALNSGFDIVVLDNLSNSSIEVKSKIEIITSRSFDFYEGDLLDYEFLKNIFAKYKFDAVVHFAGLKAVAESVINPISYYENNVGGSIKLLKVMKEYDVKQIIFSSSATVYGEPKYLPYDEEHPVNPVNPYGRTKSQVEDLIKDVCRSDSTFSAISLRYFNPVGAHSSGLIGENPSGVPSNLMPYILKVVSGELPHLNVYGNDYDTKDGTGERDFISVVDLAKGHFLALEFFKKTKNDYYVYNLGVGEPISVLRLIKAFEKVNQVKVPYKFMPRREGDLASFWADSTKSKAELKFSASFTLFDFVKMYR